MEPDSLGSREKANVTSPKVRRKCLLTTLYQALHIFHVLVSPNRLGDYDIFQVLGRFGDKVLLGKWLWRFGAEKQAFEERWKSKDVNMSYGCG